MLHLVENNENLLSLDEAKEYYNAVYGKASDANKIRLKCWLYYCECREKGGKHSIPFDQHRKTLKAVDYLSHVRGRTIDCSDMGGYDKAVDVVINYIS